MAVNLNILPRLRGKGTATAVVETMDVSPLIRLASQATFSREGRRQ